MRANIDGKSMLKEAYDESHDAERVVDCRRAILVKSGGGTTESASPLER